MSTSMDKKRGPRFEEWFFKTEQSLSLSSQNETKSGEPIYVTYQPTTSTRQRQMQQMATVTATGYAHIIVTHIHVWGRSQN